MTALARSTMKKHYSFPILEEADILLCLRELGVNVSEADLVNPTPQVVHSIFCHFIDILMNVTRDDLMQAQFTSTLEHPELHEDSIPMSTFLRSCHKLLRTVGISDFTLKDVLYPERARLRRNFSAVINFAKFREDRMERYQDFTNESEGFILQKAALEAENNKLIAEIRAINAQRASEEPRVAELEAENSQLVAHIAELNQQQAGMKEVAQSLKHKWQEIGDQISETKYTLLSAKQENDSLRAQIVPSPEKLKQALTNLAESIEHEKENIGKCHDKLRRHALTSKSLTHAERDVKKVLTLVEETELEEARVDKMGKEHDDCRAHLKGNDAALHDSTFKEHQLKRQIGSIQERTTRMHKQHNSRKEAAAEAMQTAQKEWQEVEAERQATDESLGASELQLRAESEKMQRLRAQHESEMAHISGKRDKLEQQVHGYHSQILTLIRTS
ncbi:Nuf2 family-domain-containing protein [Pavlovales sp. CCMP2436]|nr:Nuf2 family-domain-containing protein [Pavlovales sp. CCMP2436]|mmetsp:Transcript_34550/g.79780  ORF Transcript_34550/g.79780 Transcript_34550/m.79780 type:complete len:446 (-) Transcript_34550:217-1554(-)